MFSLDRKLYDNFNTNNRSIRRIMFLKSFTSFRFVCTIFNNDDAVLSLCRVDEVLVLADRSEITLFF